MEFTKVNFKELETFGSLLFTVMDFSQILASKYNMSRLWISFPKQRGWGWG
jgi:hypothetical protein